MEKKVKMQIKNKIAKIGIATLMVLLCYSCTQSTITHTYQSLPYSGWERDSILNYTVVVDSLTGKCNIDIELAYNNSYPYSNIYLFVSANDSTENCIFSDTLNIVLADEFGQWKGDGWGSLYQQREWYKKHYAFPTEGVYEIRIKQGMRDNPIQGIEKVGVRVERAVEVE
ncbi:MAG: gliding motility lipoprotein GldH [Bacteroidales bacterium]|nr:gliding motility lipoprotein GldH [Bacteroidales bacterium]MBR5532211.1 gliding motility lipoprotein GldH [Bacteroidales bacterium]